ncbi:MAG: hypothetical protein ACTSPY_12345 [Candidatus Helarchaeota archaeon]
MKQVNIIRLIISITSITGILLILFGNIKTIDNFRILSDIIQNILLFNLVLIIFMPNKIYLKISIIIGIFTMIYDLILESVAVYLNWWYPKGKYTIFGVPIEMVLSFLLIGATFCILLTFPNKLRNTNIKYLKWIKPLFRNDKFDIVWRVLLVISNAIIGTNGDYSAGTDIWEPGLYWCPTYTFLIWLTGGLVVLILFIFLEKRFMKKKSDS